MVVQEYKLSHFVCDKWYIVKYKFLDTEEVIKGFLLNYNNGNIILLSKDCIYHINYKNIVFIKPCKIDLSKYDEEFSDIFITKGDNNYD